MNSQNLVKERTGSWIQTYVGIPFYPLDPRAEDINIIDIAHALSNLCRFAGHVNQFYSVAQHSVLVSLHCAPEDALWGLLHDASEAYCVDMPRPIKHSPGLIPYRKIEQDIMNCVAQRFGLPFQEPESVKQADLTLLYTEKRDLLTMHQDWGWKVEPLPDPIVPLSPEQARMTFINRFLQLTDMYYEVDLQSVRKMHKIN